MLVAIAHNAVPPDAREDERDVLVQVRCVADAINQLGHSCELIPVTLDLQALLQQLDRLRPQVVFNLVESLGGSDRLASTAAGVLEQANWVVTGSGSDTLWLSNLKTIAKQRLVASNLPTPAWCEPLDPFAEIGDRAPAPFRRGAVRLEDDPATARYIIKPLFEHASLGMDQSSIVKAASWDELTHRVACRSRQLGRPCFAERYIEGREFNLSLL